MSVPRRAYDAKRASRSSTFSSLARQRARGRFRDFREENEMPVANGRRVAVIAGCRTPFCRSGTVLKDAPAVDLARFVPREALERTNRAGPAEPSTGESMGQSAEKMAKENHISRAAQDRWAFRSHELAARGTDDGRITAEVVPWFGPGGRAGDGVVTQDNGIRRDTSLEQMAKLKPVFDRRYGSVTAANSSPLTDGASAVLVMSDSAARALGYTPLAYVRSYAVAAVDPGWQLLQAPIFAVPKALERAGIQWKELGVIEVHEGV